jgi:hypothetical protein
MCGLSGGLGPNSHAQYPPALNFFSNALSKMSILRDVKRSYPDPMIKLWSDVDQSSLSRLRSDRKTSIAFVPFNEPRSRRRFTLRESRASGRFFPRFDVSFLSMLK